jgi:hypothetical protein
MWRSLFPVVVGAALSACGSSKPSDPASACRSGSEAVCAKAFECFPTQSQQLYVNQQGCIDAAVARVCTSTATTCPPGTQFNPDNASQCIDGYRNESCTDLQNNNVPSICYQNCI